MPAEQLAVQENHAAVIPRPTPAELLRIALSQNADIEKLKQFMDLQERWEQNEARKAFVQAMSEFKAHSIVVIKDKVNPQYNSKYASLGNLVATVTPFLSQHGLSVAWNIDQTQGIKVSCTIQHTLGHSESVAMVVPPDTSGSKNPIQQIKSAITYAKACTFESICGLASKEANLEDDGNAAGTSAMGHLAERLEWIENCRTVEELKKIYTEAFAEAKKLNDQNAMKAIVAAKDKKRKELQ